MILNMCIKFSSWHLLLLFLLTSSPARALSIELATQPGKLKYDIETFGVRPGEQVRLSFRNNDEMQHNLLILQGEKGITMKVAQMAWALGAEAVEKEFVPDMGDTVLVHTRVLDPGEKQTISFQAPKTEGKYPYVCTLPGHAFSMKGVMVVTSDPSSVTNAEKDEKKASNDKFILKPHHKPIVKRAFVRNGPPRAISVGIPGGINYCFDADSCMVTFGWFGPFLDIGPDWGRNAGQRGGGSVLVLGERFDSGQTTFPIRIGSKYNTPQVSFKGYQLRGMEAPTFEFTVNGAWVKETISASEKGIGLTYSFQMDPGLVTPIFIHLDRSDAEVEASHGTWDGNWLKIEPENIASFSISHYRQP
jgi:plastocyanin